MSIPRAGALFTLGLGVWLWTAALTGQSAPAPRPPQAAPQTPGEPPQVFRGGTTLVPVDVRVLDRLGKPVTDLGQQDFTVLENGRPQAIRHFSTQAFVARPPGPADAMKARTTTMENIAGQDRRVFLIVLGRGRLQPPAKGVDGMIHFVQERLLPQDLVAVIAWNRATEFTTDHAKVADLLQRFERAHEGIEAKLKMAFSGLAAIYGTKDIPQSLQHDIDDVFGGPTSALGVRSTQPSEGPNGERLIDDRRTELDNLMDAARSDPSGVADTALEDFVEANAQTMQDMGKLYAGIEYLRHFDGEKHLVFVSESGLVLPRAEDDRDLAALAADARVAVDYIHTGGVSMTGMRGGVSPFAAERGGSPGRAALPTPGPGRGQMVAFSSMGWQMNTARALADLTGGRFYAGQLKDALADMDDVDQATRFGYILGYYPSNPTADASYRQIRVVVHRPGVTVLYRHGYYANPSVAPLDREHLLTYSRIAAAANYPNAVPDITIRAKAIASKPPAAAEVTIDMTIDPSRLAFAKSNGRNVKTLDMLVACLDGRDNLMGEMWKSVVLTFTDERLAAVAQNGVPVTVTVPVNGPSKNVKIILYDYAADLVGSVVVKVQ